MISYIRGELCDIEEQKAIVDVNGVGYGIYMPQQALSLLPPMGQQVKIHTYLNIREDAMQLFWISDQRGSECIPSSDRCEWHWSKSRIKYFVLPFS